MFASKEELRNFANDQLEEIDELIAESRDEVDKIQEEIRNLDKASDDLTDECKKDQKSLYDDLDEKSKQLLAEKEQLEKKEDNCKFFGLAISGIYIALAAVILFVLKVDFPIADVWVYLSAAAIAIVLFVVSVIIKKAPIKKRLSEIYCDDKIYEYHKTYLEIREKYYKIIDQNHNQIYDLKQKKYDIEKDVAEGKDTKNTIIKYIEELDVIWEYRDAILFCGKESGTIYDIYIDGVLYDSVKRNNPIKIKLTPGLHSFKVEYTTYNIDNSIMGGYNFNTIQIEIDPEKIPTFNAFICDYKSLERVKPAEFEKKAKIRLL